jgi:hypothetical protein
MIVEQINAIFEELNSQFGANLYDYTTDADDEPIWMNMTEISEVILSSDACLYPDGTIQYAFDHYNEVIRSRTGRLEDNGDFTPNREVAAISYDAIVGFILVKPSSNKSPYKKGATV